MLSVVFLSVCFFSASYKFFEDYVVASTGYNETENGLFAWRSSYARHESRVDGDYGQLVLVDSGVVIDYTKLASEIALWTTLSFGICTLAWIVIWLTTKRQNREGEQDGEPDS